MSGLFGYQGGVGGGGAGTPGADGATWLNGAIDPAANIGSNNDYYINTASYDIFQKQSGAWVKIGNLKGAAGATGPGVPVGGTAGQFLSKKSDTDYDTQWVAAPTGGGSTDGWNPVNAALSYASATTMNINADLTLVIPKYAKVRWRQGGAYKYAYITDITATLWTINAGIDYSVADTPITDVAWSVANPAIGFPGYFNWLPEYIASGGMTGTIDTVVSSTFSIIACYVYFDIHVTGTLSGTASNYLGLSVPPIDAKDIGGMMAYGRIDFSSSRSQCTCRMSDRTSMYLSNYNVSNFALGSFTLYLNGSYLAA
jgi:hypothetical protein